MPVFLEYLYWVFFVYSEKERYHVHVYKNGDSKNTESAKLFLAKNGKRAVSWASYGKYRKNADEIMKIVELEYDWLIYAAKQSEKGVKVKMKKVTRKTKKI